MLYFFYHRLESCSWTIVSYVNCIPALYIPFLKAYIRKLFERKKYIYIFLLPSSFYASKSYCKSMKKISNCSLSHFSLPSPLFVCMQAHASSHTPISQSLFSWASGGRWGWTRAEERTRVEMWSWNEWLERIQPLEQPHELWHFFQNFMIEKPRSNYI